MVWLYFQSTVIFFLFLPFRLHLSISIRTWIVVPYWLDGNEKNSRNPPKKVPRGHFTDFKSSQKNSRPQRKTKKQNNQPGFTLLWAARKKNMKPTELERLKLRKVTFPVSYSRSSTSPPTYSIYAIEPVQKQIQFH